MKQYLSFLVLVLGLFLSVSLNAQQWITNVTIAPATPSTCDSVMVTVDGDLPATNYSFTSSQFHVSGSLITLNLFYDSQGFGNPTITPFTHTDNIGVYAAGSYVVNVDLYFNGNLADQHSGNFTVVQGGTVSVDIGNDTTLCQGRPLTLDAGTSNASYLWSTGDTSATIQVNTSGTYWVEVTSGGCTVSDTIEVSYYPAAQVNVGADTLVPAGDTLTLDAGVQSDYHWNTGDTGRYLTVTTAGSYGITVTDTNGCTASDTIIVDFSTGIEAGNPSDVVRVYPNPANERIWLDAGTEQLKVYLLDQSGRLLATPEYTNGKPVSFDLSGLPRGVYFIRLDDHAAIPFIKD